MGERERGGGGEIERGRVGEGRGGGREIETHTIKNKSSFLLWSVCVCVSLPIPIVWAVRHVGGGCRQQACSKRPCAGWRGCLPSAGLFRDHVQARGLADRFLQLTPATV